MADDVATTFGAASEFRTRNDASEVLIAVPTLRALRADRLLTIRDLAQQAGVAPSSIHLIETGRVTPRASTMRRLATALGVDPLAVAEFQQAIEAAQEPYLQRRRTAAR